MANKTAPEPTYPDAVPGEERYVDQDEKTGLWCVFGADSGHAYASFSGEEQADDWLKEHPRPEPRYVSELDHFCQEKGITVALVSLGREVLRDGDKPWEVESYTATLHLGNRKLSAKISQGWGSKNLLSVADVLSSLLIDASCGDQSFEDYCSEFGVNSDSRKEHTKWLNCRRMVPRVKRFLQDLFEEARKKEH